MNLFNRCSALGKILVVLGLVLFVSSVSQADQFHYNNVIIGDRALGLAGAYTAVSDDSSGVYYNPAGLGFALSNDISGSANAFYTKTYTYKKTIGSQDYVERSAGSIPSFFGGLQKLDELHKGLVAGFGLYSTDSELRDQNDTIENALNINRLHRTQNMRSSTYFYSAAVGLRVASGISVGLALSYMTVDELFQDYQDVDQNMYDTSGGLVGRLYNMQNQRMYLTAAAFEPALGIQWAVLPSVSLGLVVKKGSYVTQKYDLNQDQRYFYHTQILDDSVNTTTDKTTYCPGGLAACDVGASTGGPGSIKSKKPLGSMPLKARLGAAWFASPRLLVSSDIQYFAAVTDTDKALKGLNDPFKREAVMDYSAGLEYYLTPSIPVRAGYFTNHDARKTVKTGGRNQFDHVDFQGGTLFLAMVQPNSQISFGVVQQNGAGKAQKIGGVTTIQDVEVNSTTFALSASHNF